MIIVARYESSDRMTLDRFEYLEKNNGEQMKFKSEEEAREFLLGNGISEDELYNYMFMEEIYYE